MNIEKLYYLFLDIKIKEDTKTLSKFLRIPLWDITYYDLSSGKRLY